MQHVEGLFSRQPFETEALYRALNVRVIFSMILSISKIKDPTTGPLQAGAVNVIYCLSQLYYLDSSMATA